MRAGLDTIQQTLTPEASSVLNQSISEAGRRNHIRTAPLHVAAALLASPSGFLRQACIKSHPNSSHPLQCRALELCFRVALDRLPTAQNMNPTAEPPMSHALMAALKRAQSHQRRGCPEQQQQPLLAVKVELEQLIISILDDPSVSRVMREASFSSPAVKEAIEQSVSSSLSPVVNSNSIGSGFRPDTVSTIAFAPNRNLYLNPRLQKSGISSQLGQLRGEEVKKVIDILLRTKKRNPILVGESKPVAIVKEILKRIENKEMGDEALSNIQVVHLEKMITSDKLQIPTKIKELGDFVETRMVEFNCNGVLINLGDLKWLVEQPVDLGVASSGNILQQAVTEASRAGVVEMRKLLVRFKESGDGHIWLIGTPTCETYLRCQVYHPSMENDWDLQTVPIASKPHMLGMFSRTNNILGSPLESLSMMKCFPTTAITQTRHAPENLDPSQRTNCCPQCLQCYEQELRIILEELEKSASEVKTETIRPSLPQWLQNAKANNKDNKSPDETQSKNHEMISKKTQELQKKWKDSCVKLHPHFLHQNLISVRITPTAFSMTGLFSPNLLGLPPSQPKLHPSKALQGTLQLKRSAILNQSSDKVASPPASPVRTDLVLAQTKVADANSKETHEHDLKNFLGCKSSEPENKVLEWKNDRSLGALDADSYKQLVKGLTQKVWWQSDAASAVATTITQCKLGNGKRRSGRKKGDMWLLFMGPDRVGKRKMATALSEHVSASKPIIISLGSRRYLESDASLRGKTALDKIAEAVRRNPFSVILLEDIDEADILLRGSIKRAMDRGRLNDAHGREISLGNVIFILTANCLPDNLHYLSNGISFDEDKLASLPLGGWQLKLSISEKVAKRRTSWPPDENRAVKPRKETLYFTVVIKV